ncbi:IMPACT family protein [Mycoplasmopsis felis]|uniref:IMPACT family protein n=1 Tax=Mycoplasmopsis felis TaxID=33923 RepID=UPI003A4DC47C
MTNFYIDNLIIKKSKFISITYEINNKKEVQEILDKLNVEHKKATHICYAYSLIENGVEIAGFSDDGEPKGTAGKPMYDLLKLKNLFGVLIVVIRYYGGVKLGAGGLVRSYRQASMLTINQILNKGIQDDKNNSRKK